MSVRERKEATVLRYGHDTVSHTHMQHVRAIYRRYRRTSRRLSRSSVCT